MPTSLFSRCSLCKGPLPDDHDILAGSTCTGCVEAMREMSKTTKPKEKMALATKCSECKGPLPVTDIDSPFARMCPKCIEKSRKSKFSFVPASGMPEEPLGLGYDRLQEAVLRIATMKVESRPNVLSGRTTFHLEYMVNDGDEDAALIATRPVQVIKHLIQMINELLGEDE